MKVSAIISTFRSARFIEGCLEDLFDQTLYKQGQLEIIVVVSGSPENEAEIVQRYQPEHPNLIMIVTQRETMYGAWNRGVKFASGEYLTNANTDDRHAPDALERQAKYLDSHKDCDLAYGDVVLSLKENEPFSQNPKDRVYRYPRFFGPSCALYYQLGPHAMWRKSLHDKIGLFDASFKAAGDYDFNCRAALAARGGHIGGAPTGSYLVHTGAISHRDDTIHAESDRVRSRFRAEDMVEKLYANAGASVSTPRERAIVHLDLGLRSLEYFPAWFEGGSHRELDFALTCFERAARIDPLYLEAKNNLAVALAALERFDDAMKIWNECSGFPPADRNTAVMMARSGSLELCPSPLPFPSERDLASGKSNRHPVLFVHSDHTIKLDAPNGGAETATLDLVRQLSKAGVPCVLAGKISGQDPSIETWDIGSSYDTFSALERMAERGPFHLVSTGRTQVLNDAKRVPQCETKILLLHSCGTDIGVTFPTAGQISDRLVCVSDALKDRIVSQGADPSKCDVIPNGVDLSLFSPGRADDRDWKRIVFAGALVPDKGLHLLIEAFAMLKAEFRDLKLDIYGSAGLWGRTESFDPKAIEAAFPNVKFHGPVPRERLADVYRKAGLLVFPSLWFETFGLSIAEALATGCPVVATDVGGPRQIVKDGVNGLLVREITTPALTAAIRRIISDPNLQRRMSEQALANREELGWELTVKKLLGTLEGNIAS